MIFESFANLENATKFAKSINHSEQERAIVCENRTELSSCEGYLFDLMYPVVFIEAKRPPSGEAKDIKRAELSLRAIVGAAKRYGASPAAVIRGGAQ